MGRYLGVTTWPPSSAFFLGSGYIRNRKKLWLIAVVGVVVAMSILHVVTTGLIGDLTYLSVVVGGGVVACFGIRRHPAGRRLPWCYIALGVLCSAIGEMIWTFLLWLNGAGPDVSVADFFWIVSYVGVFAGLWQLLRARRIDRRVGGDALIDMVAVAAVSVVLAWQFAIVDTIADSSVPMTVRLVWATYPILDAMLLTLVLRTIFSYGKGSFTGGLLAVGVLCWLVSDIAFLLVVTSDRVSRAFDGGWMFGAALLAAAIWHRPTAEMAPEPPAETVGRGRIAFGMAPLLIPGAIEAWGAVHGKDADPWPLLVLTVILVALAYVRSVRILDAAERARARLQSREHHFRALAANSSDAVLVVDRDGKILDGGIGSRRSSAPPTLRQ